MRKVGPTRRTRWPRASRVTTEVPMVRIRLPKTAGWGRDPTDPSFGCREANYAQPRPLGSWSSQKSGRVLEAAGFQGRHGKVNIMMGAVHTLCENAPEECPAAFCMALCAPLVGKSRRCFCLCQGSPCPTLLHQPQPIRPVL